MVFRHFGAQKGKLVPENPEKISGALQIIKMKKFHLIFRHSGAKKGKLIHENHEKISGVHRNRKMEKTANQFFEDWISKMGNNSRKICINIQRISNP